MEGCIMTATEKGHAVSAKKQKIPADWKGLVTELYLLRPIRTKGDYNRAVHIVDMLAGRTDLNKDQADYLESLSVLIEAYENEHNNFDADHDPIETLKFLLKILNGVRSLSKRHIKILAEHFSVEPGLFL
jgi:antitoxin component HigA of HigAB toxin-antitoxin module